MDNLLVSKSQARPEKAARALSDDTKNEFGFALRWVSSTTPGRRISLLSTSSLARTPSWVSKTSYFNIKLDISVFIELERSIRMGPVDFVASLGGLFGLCLGFSIISFIEIIYWVVAGVIRSVLGKVLS